MSSLPAEFSERMIRLLGSTEFESFAASLDEPPLHALRINPLKYPPAEENEECGSGEMAGLSPEICFPGVRLQNVPWTSDGFYFEPSDTFRPGRSPFHEAGVYYIQEPSAMAPAVCLDARPGEAVLDLCAAPGGKSTQIAAAMKQRGLLVANEIIPSRAKILSGNIERCGIRNAVVTNESPQRLADAWPEFFDRILVDAPCSGEGMFRKNPEAVKEWSPDAVRSCALRQDEILSCAARMLRPGGTLVYSTCTFNPEENEGTLTRFLRSHHDFYMEKPPFDEKEMMDFGFSRAISSRYSGAPEELSEAIRIFPHRAKGEGHFMAILKRNESARQISRYVSSLQPSPTVRPHSGDQAADGYGNRQSFSGRPARSGNHISPLLQDFLRDTLLPAAHAPADMKDSSRILSFGDQLYLLPQDTPPLDGIRILRAGLHLGTLKKKRFEPSHALALTLSACQVTRSFDLTIRQAACWITGAAVSVPPDTPAGWTLMTVKGYSLGWGKCAGGVMKNHYPKGLRKNF